MTFFDVQRQDSEDGADTVDSCCFSTLNIMLFIFAMSSSSDDSSSDNDDRVPSNDPPASVKRRRRSSVQQKMEIICTAARLMEQEGMTCCKAYRDVNVHPTMHLLWSKQAEAMMKQKKHNIRARSMHLGRIHCLAEHTEETLLAFIFELREKGMGVPIPMVPVKAAQISKSFNNTDWTFAKTVTASGKV
jgi:hypothetical protein